MTSDEELIALTLTSGDRRAYGELVSRHQSRVRAWLRQLTGDPTDADDLAQETFMKAWEKLRSYRGEGRFVSWLMKLAYNEFLQSRRREERRGRLGASYREETAALQAAGEEGRGELAPDLPRLLSVLGETERQVLLLNYGCGFSHAEIGEVLDIPAGTVKSHIHRGKARIREAFGLEHDS